MAIPRLSYDISNRTVVRTVQDLVGGSLLRVVRVLKAHVRSSSSSSSTPRRRVLFIFPYCFLFETPKNKVYYISVCLSQRVNGTVTYQYEEEVSLLSIWNFRFSFFLSQEKKREIIGEHLQLLSLSPPCCLPRRSPFLYFPFFVAVCVYLFSF